MEPTCQAGIGCQGGRLEDKPRGPYSVAALRGADWDALRPPIFIAGDVLLTLRGRFREILSIRHGEVLPEGERAAIPGFDTKVQPRRRKFVGAIAGKPRDVPQPAPRKSSLKNIGNAALQPIQDLLQVSEGDALLALLQPMQRGRRESKFLGELGVGHFTALLAQEITELPLKRIGHAAMLAKGSFRLWNNSIEMKSSSPQDSVQ